MKYLSFFPVSALKSYYRLHGDVSRIVRLISQDMTIELNQPINLNIINTIIEMNTIWYYLIVVLAWYFTGKGLAAHAAAFLAVSFVGSKGPIPTDRTRSHDRFNRNPIGRSSEF